MENIQQPCCGVIPEHMLSHIAKSGDAEVSERARITLYHMRSLTTLRSQGVDQTEAAIAVRKPKKQRAVYDAKHQRRLPGKLVMTEHKPRSTDIQVTEAYDGMGSTYDLYLDAFDRNSIDGLGKRFEATVYYGFHFDNALWDGERVIFGDGDQRIFGRFTSCPEITGHEYSHGLTQYTAGLGYTGQNGALNEHISDAFGIMVKQFILGQVAADSKWLIGEGLLMPTVHGEAIRSMAEPGTAYNDPVLGRDPQPGHMRDYVNTREDNGGVHINSGIPNRAFYLAAMSIGGHTWEVVGQVWYEVVKRRLRRDADFAQFARATVDVGGEKFGFGGVAQRAITAAWAAVGIDVSLVAPQAMSIPPTHTQPRRPHEARPEAER
jgi:Zn-dependent metalloprotease